METHDLLVRQVDETDRAHVRAMAELVGALGWMVENDDLHPERVREWLGKVTDAGREYRVAVTRLTEFHERAKGTPLFEAAS